MWRGVEKRKYRLCCCYSLKLEKNEGSRTSEGMIGNSILLAVILTVMSVMSLSLLSLLCLRCKRKSKIIQEEHQVYNTQTFQHRGSMFAVTRSKTVTRDNQIPSTRIETREGFFPAATEEQSDYQNISEAQTGSMEHMYVAPLPISVYENQQTGKGTTDADQDPGVYANIGASSLSVASYEEYDDYENSQFLDNAVREAERCSTGPPPETDEPDYVNENGD